MNESTRNAEERREECRQRHKVQYFMTAADYLFGSDWERCNLEDRFQKPDPVLMAMTCKARTAFTTPQRKLSLRTP